MFGSGTFVSFCELTAIACNWCVLKVAGDCDEHRIFVSKSKKMLMNLNTNEMPCLSTHQVCLYQAEHCQNIAVNLWPHLEWSDATLSLQFCYCFLFHFGSSIFWWWSYGIWENEFYHQFCQSGWLHVVVLLFFFVLLVNSWETISALTIASRRKLIAC